MTEDEEKLSEARRKGYRAGWAKGKRDHEIDKDNRIQELMQALREALDLDLDHPTAVLAKYEKRIKPIHKRARKICKGSIVRWKEDNMYIGGTLTKFMRYEHGVGEIWTVTHMPSGKTTEKLITLDMITKFGPKRRPSMGI